MDISRERRSPHIALTRGVKVDPAHASLSSVRSTNEGRRLGHDLSEMSRTGVEVLCQGSEDGEVIRQNFGNADTIGLAVIEGSLESAKQASGAWNSSADKPEFAKDSFPMLPTDTTPSG